MERMSRAVNGNGIARKRLAKPRNGVAEKSMERYEMEMLGNGSIAAEQL